MREHIFLAVAHPGCPDIKRVVLPTGRVRCSNAAKNENARLGRKVKFARDKIPLGGKKPEKRIYSVAAPRRPNTVQSWVGLR